LGVAGRFQQQLWLPIVADDFAQILAMVRHVDNQWNSPDGTLVMSTNGIRHWSRNGMFPYHPWSSFKTQRC